MRLAKTLIGLSVLSLLTACGTDIFTTKPRAEPKAKTGIETVALQSNRASEKTTNRRQIERPQRKINDDPKQLLALGPGDLADKLGSPGFVRRDGHAEIWQYLAEACVLDVFLYRDNNALAVDYVELRGRGAATLSRRACFREMLRAQLSAEKS